MPNTYFQFKQFTIHQDRSAMKVTTDACLFGAWCATEINQDCKDREKLLDIGTGTGLLSLMIGQKNNLLIDAVEIEENAAKQADENIKSTPWADRIHVIQKNIKDFKSERKYKFIISNPPFYENELAGERLEKNMAHHDAGLKMNELLEYVQINLEEDGCFYLLLPAKRSNEIGKMITEQKLFISKKILVKQSTQHEPFRVMIKGSHHPNETLTSELPITDATQNYTPEFIELLKDYYLYL